MARMTIIQKRNVICSRLLDLRVDALKRSLRYRLSETDRLQREILKCLAPGSFCCKACMSKFSGIVCSDKMDHKTNDLRLQHSLEDIAVSEKHVHKRKPERSHSDNNMKLTYQEHIPVTNRGHATLVDLKAHHGSKRTLHGIPNTSQLTPAGSEFKLGSLAHHQMPGELHASNKPRHSEMFSQSSVKITEAGDANASDTNITAFLFSRHCRHGYVMKKATDPTEPTTDHIKSKIRAKVVKNYLLQDVFKRLNSTKTIVGKNNVSERNANKQTDLTPETIQTLEQCRYLRMPLKKTVQGTEDADNEDDKLPKVDVK